jgi:hypothetical protein
MARRRHENGLKYHKRLESEQQRANRPDGSSEPDNRQPDPAPPAPVPPGVTQMFESAAAPLLAPHDPNRP